MKIEIKIDESCREPKIIIVTDKMTEEINETVKRLAAEQPKMIAGFLNDQVAVLDKNRIFRIMRPTEKYMPKRITAHIFCVCGCMRRNSALTAECLLGYQTAKS